MSHSAKTGLLDSICAGLNSKRGVKIVGTWAEIEQSHSNFYRIGELLELIEELAVIIEQADAELVKADFESSQSITLRNVPRQEFTIGETPYLYTHLAY